MGYRFTTKPCPECGHGFTPTGGAQKRCAECKAKSVANAHHDPRACRGCGLEFRPKSSAEKYCAQCREKRSKIGTYRLYKMRRTDDEESPAKAGARPGDFKPPTGNCARCGAVVRLSRTEEWRVLIRKGGHQYEQADRILVCIDCYQERALSRVQPESPDGIWAARSAAVARCLTILLGLERQERRAAWAQLGRAMGAVKA